MGFFINAKKAAGGYINGKKLGGFFINAEKVFPATPAGPTPSPGTVTPRGVRNNRSRIQSLSAVLADSNGVTAVNSVTFRIVTGDGTVRFSHTMYTLRTTLPANSVIINAANIPSNFRAGGRNSLQVEVNYTDPTGTYTETGTALFTTQ